MGLVDFAKEELERAGLFKKDSDYEGQLGKAVLALVKVFAKQGHSGFSAQQAIEIFGRVAKYKILTPIDTPVESDYSVVCDDRTNGKTILQHRRLSSLFSSDNGKTWYDIDAKRTLWDRLTGKVFHNIQFPYWPENSR